MVGSWAGGVDVLVHVPAALRDLDEARALVRLQHLPGYHAGIAESRCAPYVAWSAAENWNALFTTGLYIRPLAAMSRSCCNPPSALP